MSLALGGPLLTSCMKWPDPVYLIGGLTSMVTMIGVFFVPPVYL